MGITINAASARQILTTEAGKASTSPDVIDEWTEELRNVIDACGEGSLTFIAALGTALLAKATNLRVDVFSLKASTGSRGYSARSLAQHVLAASAPRLNLDLGVHGREPLNNSPFYKVEKIHKNLLVHANARAAFNLLVKILGRIDKISSTGEARLALRSFLRLRIKKRVPIAVGDEDGDALTLHRIAEVLARFVGDQSEKGKRAQAAVAGILDGVTAPDRVMVGKVNDPDQRFPGDVGMLAAESSDTLERTFEVRDKPVTQDDLDLLVTKCRERNVSRAAMVAIADGQKKLDVDAEWAFDEGVALEVFISWDALIQAAVFWTDVPVPKLPGLIFRAVVRRAEELEVSVDGIKLLQKLDPSLVEDAAEPEK